MKKMLVIIDMVNGFVKTGALADGRINEITPNIISLIKIAKANNIPIVAFRDCHHKNDEEFKTFPEHCLKGSYESELISELKPYEKDFAYNIEKCTTNGFVTKKFQKILESNDLTDVVVTGCCTDICVKNFVESYLKYVNSSNKKVSIEVVEDACSTFDNENHSAELEHKNALYEMQQKGAKIVNMQKFLSFEKDKTL